MKNSKLLIGTLIIFIGLILFFNNKISNNSSSKQTNTYTVSNMNSTSASAIGNTAPDFRLTTLDNQEFRLSSKQGKTVILFGMAGWCATCIPEGRVLTKIRQEYANKGIEVIGIAFTKGDNDDFLKEFKKVGGIDIPLALDTDNVAQKYNLTRLETTYIIDKEGRIAYKDEKTTTYEEYKKELDKII